MSPALDVEAVRRDFPILSTKMNGRPLVYLDNGATTQKPRAVIDRIVRYYESENANIHRGLYQLSQKATDAYEEVRRAVARFTTPCGTITSTSNVRVALAATVSYVTSK